ncbi:Na(+)/H(+) exchange regulatory cofactor NHE-RF1 [Amia ocellicauda]|uniref:Na(+)/H(+) exchange regulatory cofactor NHE-RF1 n=1 Tax=Amia ocellicauda TaxID=2972642 RepID=UPI0034639B9A
MSSDGEAPRPRSCVLEKGSNGYGFHLHGEKGKTGQFIRLVEPDSPAEVSGLRAGDRLVFVNGDNVENDSHQQVVSRIRASAGELRLVVVDRDTDELLKKYSLQCQPEFVTAGIPVPAESEGAVEENGSRRDSTPTPEKNGDVIRAIEKKLSISSDKESKSEHRPRLCKIKKGSTGYGFNLHSEKSKPGQYIRAVDAGSPAEKSGLLPQDRIVAVNGISMEGKQHSDVVSAIKNGGEETSLLVVDPDTDSFFKKCKVIPTEAHLTGPLPEPVVNGDVEEKANGKVAKEPEPKVSVSPSPSTASSNTSLSSAPASTPVLEEKPEDKDSGVDPALSLTLSLQQAKERAHQKRSNKRAPQMDWSKKNELFSNL